MASIDIGAKRQRLETNRVTTPMKPPSPEMTESSQCTDKLDNRARLSLLNQ